MQDGYSGWWVVLPLICPLWRDCAAAKLLESCPTLCDPIDGSPPGSLSLGFSTKGYWSGLPFPSPIGKIMCMCILWGPCGNWKRVHPLLPHLNVAELTDLTCSLHWNAERFPLGMWCWGLASGLCWSAYPHTCSYRTLGKLEKVKKEHKYWSLLILRFLFLPFKSHNSTSVLNGVSLLTLFSYITVFMAA